MLTPRPNTGAAGYRPKMGLVAIARPSMTRSFDGSRYVEPDAVLEKFVDGWTQLVFLTDRDLPFEALSEFLSEDERARLARMSSLNAAHQFIAGRWLLRTILAAVTGGTPEQVSLEYDLHGKPRMARPPAGGIDFSLSHSGHLAVLALGRNGRVGVDIERIRPLSDISRLARRILTAKELAGFEASPQEEQSRPLIAAWARKEAVLKALGTGISGSPSSVEVTLDCTLESVEFLALATGHVPERWTVRTLAMPPEFQGALALEGPASFVAVWQAFPVRPGP